MPCAARRERRRFAKAWDKAAARGAKKGEPCVLTDDAPTAATALVTDPTAAFLADVLEGWDEAAGSGDDDQLRASLIQEGAGLCSKLWGADGRQMAKRNDAKWEKGHFKARGRFDAKGQKAIDKAAGKGVVYGGAPVEALGDALTDVVARGTERTAGVAR